MTERPTPPGATTEPAQPEPFVLLSDLDPPATLERSLGLIAERLREAFDVHAVVIRAADSPDGGGETRGFSVAERARPLAPALRTMRPSTSGLGLAAVGGGRAVVWPDLLLEPAFVARLDEIERSGTSLSTWRPLLEGGSGVVMPLRTSGNPQLGAVALFNVRGGRTLGAAEQTPLEALSPQIALAVQNAMLRSHGVRTGRTLEALLETAETGIIVLDLAGRFSMVNPAASALLGVDLAPQVGQPMRRVLVEELKWRFKDPEGFQTTALAPERDPTIVLRDELETVDGGVLRRFTAPIRDAQSELIGRMVMLTDVTEGRRLLAEARALAEENASLLEREERRSQEEIALARAAHVMASALTRGDIHQHLVEQAEELVGSEKTAVLVVRRRGEVAPVATRGFSSEGQRALRVPRGEGIAGRVIRSRHAFICNDVETDLPPPGPLVEQGIRSFVQVPIELGERVYGLVLVTSSRPRAFGQRDLRVLSELTRDAAAALQNALQFEQERHIAETLQDALLAEEPPAVPGLALATLYRAAAGAMVGGDLYNIWRLGDERVAVLVGDVSGKGVDAAGVTAMVRFLAEGLSRYEEDPARLLTELNRLVITRLSDGALVTLFLAVFDPQTGALRWCNAGHPPPLLVDAERTVQHLAHPGPPCGVFAEPDYITHETAFAPRDLLFLYTDGLIEARRRGEAFGEERLCRAVLDAAEQEPSALASAVYGAARTWTRGGITDDVAIAVVRRLP